MGRPTFGIQQGEEGARPEGGREVEGSKQDLREVISHHQTLREKYIRLHQRSCMWLTTPEVEAAGRGDRGREKERSPQRVSEE